jgi:hypothetical protein
METGARAGRAVTAWTVMEVGGGRGRGRGREGERRR